MCGTVFCYSKDSHLDRRGVKKERKRSILQRTRFKWSNLVTVCYQALKDRMMSVLTIYQESVLNGVLLRNVFQNIQITSVIQAWLSNSKAPANQSVRI